MQRSECSQVSADQPISQLLRRLWRHIGARRHGQVWLLLGLMLLSSFAEIFTIGAVLPFLAALTAPERVFRHPLAQPFIHALGLAAPGQMLLPLTIAFGVIAVAACAIRLLLLWATTRLSFAIGADLSISIYRRTLFQPYAVHCGRNSSEIISTISSKTNAVIANIILPGLMLVSSSVMLTVILVTMLSVEPILTLAAFTCFGAFHFSIMRLTRRKLLADSQLMSRGQTQVIKSLQEGLGGIRDVLIDGTQSSYCEIYRDAAMTLRRAQGNSAFIGGSPRYLMEALGMLLIVGLAYALAQQAGGITRFIPVLGVLALGAQRLLPVLQLAFGSWAAMQSGHAYLNDTLTLLDQPLPEYADQPPASPLPFRHAISLRHLAFRYSPQAPLVLEQVNLTIPKGSHVGFIGATGNGKSTLLDIVMGLLPPTEGTLEIDGQPVTEANQRAWQAHIAHVPQSIFLADSSVEENIAFGLPKDRIDRDRVRKAAQLAQISETIESWPKKYQTFVGERGIRLSGGQRQRIGIARALYKQADVIIFDEATNALDNETELAVMQAIEEYSKDLTILIVAHRLSTLKNCRQIVELKAGRASLVDPEVITRAMPAPHPVAPG